MSTHTITGSGWSITVEVIPGSAGLAATIESDLKTGVNLDYDSAFVGAIDGLESLVLSLAAAGVPVWEQPYAGAIEDAVGAVLSQHE